MGLFYIICHSPRSSFLASAARKNKNKEDNNQDSITRPMINAQSLNPYDNPNHNDGEEGSLSQLKVEKGKVKICICNLALFHNSWGLILNFSFIYFLHRLIRGIIDLYRLQHEMTTPYTVPYLHLCFQIGFFISICSIFVLVIEKIWIFTIIQLLIIVFSCCQAIFHFTKTLIFYPLLFVFGLCCEFSYINVLYLMMYDDTKNKKQRELVASWCMFLLTLFIVLSTVIIYLIELFFIQKKINRTIFMIYIKV